MNKKLVLMLLAMVMSITAWAQTAITGTVVSAEDGEPIIGATVKVKGQSKGAVTDITGKFTINVAAGTTLEFSYVGMSTLDVKAKNGMKVSLRGDDKTLDEVVVTATGLKRQEKTLGYASTTIKSDDITMGHSADAMSGLQGKIAGVQISSAGGTGTSQKVIVRGYSSLTGSNQPLYVIDGVPMSNSTAGVQDLYNSIDFGNDAADINPDDIESMTVLKGASATALYGSRASNGVILINTKRGARDEKIKVTYDGTFSASTVLRIPNLQNKFGQGWGYSHDAYGSYGTNLFENYAPCENGSWGNVLDGRQVEWRPGASWYDGADPSYTSFSYKENSLKNFYTTGFEANNNVSIEGGTKNSGYVFSYGNVYSDGILPGNSDYYKRNTFSLRANTKLFKERAWINYSINYVQKSIRNAQTGQGSDGSVIYQDILQYPVNVDYADLKDYSSVYNNKNNFYTPYAQNPWWILDHNYGTYTDDHVYGNAEFGINIIKGLQFITRGGMDVTNYTQKMFNCPMIYEANTYAYDEGSSDENGSYSERVGRRQEWDVNFMLNADYRFAKDWSIHGVLGANLNERKTRYTYSTLSGLKMADWASFENTSSASPTTTSYETCRRLAGFYGQADLGWKDAVYLTLTGREDISSTLPKNDNAYFYWGVNGSVLLTELFPSIKNDVLSFLKIRGGYGKTGNDADVYQTAAYYRLASATGGFGTASFPLNSYVGYTRNSVQPATTLKPEISTEAEVGFDARFFDNRLSIDFAYYNKRTENQIITATMAPESGYTNSIKNVGSIRNKGIELSVGITPIRNKNFSWDMTYTFSKNWNKVESLWDDVTEYTVYGLSSGPQLKAIVGQSMTTWVDYPVKTVTDESSPYYGYTIVNSTTGLPQYDNTKQEVIGSADPDFQMGLVNKFHYKGFTLGFTFDWRKGGVMYSATKGIVMFNGNAEETMYNMRDPYVEQHAVYLGSDGEYHENNIPVNAYYGINGEYYSNYNYTRYRDELVSKSYLKLREVSLSYTMPKKWFSNLSWLESIQVSLVARNLLMWTKQGLIDPDQTNYGNDLESEYGEYYSAPSTRTIGGNIKIVF